MAFRFCVPIILPVLGLLSACTENMRLKMDAAWETLDPMGHRSEHQAHYYPRGRNSGLRLPDAAQTWKSAGMPGSKP